MNARTLFAGLVLFGGSAGAQVTFTETEPNGQKSEATLATGMVAGDMITGTSTGFSTAGANPAPTSSDTFRVKMAALPLGIYRHTLTMSSSSNDADLLGVFQLNGVIQTTETVFQFSFNSAAANTNTWYGFGKQEEVYWRVHGTSSTTSPYQASLSTQPVVPISVAGMFMAGSITVTTVGQGHSTDTEIYVYDGNLTPIPLGHSDGLTPGDPALSTVTLTLPGGTYFVAVSTFNTSNDQSDLNPNEFWDSDALLDFPNVMANTNGFGGSALTFSVSDGTTTTQVPAMHMGSFDIAWATFTVGSPTTAYCFGDGSGTACPCGNSGSAGNGCASSVSPAGAHLGASGSANVSSDSLVLMGSGMSNSSALYFQGTAQLNGGAGLVFGDGLRCVGGSIVRLKTVTSSGGASQFPQAGDPSVSTKGMVGAPGTRMYQVWYRNAAPFCTASTFNLTSGLEVSWGP